jgi:hypothetical protein
MKILFIIPYYRTEKIPMPGIRFLSSELSRSAIQETYRFTDELKNRILGVAPP